MVTPWSSARRSHLAFREGMTSVLDITPSPSSGMACCPKRTTGPAASGLAPSTFAPHGVLKIRFRGI